MSFLNLISLFSLVAIANGHLSIDKSKHFYQRERMAGLANVEDVNEHRSLQLEKEFQLQLAWWNWNLCTNAYPNASFTPPNSFVPNNTVFLAGYPTNLLDDSPDTCKSKTVTRTGTISTGEQTLFFPVVNYPVIDYADNWQTGTCGVTLPNETDAVRISTGEGFDAQYSDATFKEKTYYSIDGENVEPVYLYDKSFYLLSACADNRTYEEFYKLLLGIDSTGDTCDFEPFQTIGGLDIGPMLGYYGIDTRTWADGESHTYEFGSLANCITAKYIITAKAPSSEGKCGLFGLGFFCPIAWLKWLFGLFA